MSPPSISFLDSPLLQSKILQVVHRNQYDLLKSHTIQDCLAWAFEYIHQCKQSGKQTVILKLDSPKCLIWWNMMLFFRQWLTWLAWMKCIICNASSLQALLPFCLMRVPGKKLSVRGVSVKGIGSRCYFLWTRPTLFKLCLMIIFSMGI